MFRDTQSGSIDIASGDVFVGEAMYLNDPNLTTLDA
jgi:hypothetical protein